MSRTIDEVFDAAQAATPLPEGFELFSWFSVPLKTTRKDGRETTTPLWKVTKRTPTRGEKKALQTADHAKPLVKVGRPGSPERVAAYAAYYADPSNEGVSPFEIPEID